MQAHNFGEMFEKVERQLKEHQTITLKSILSQKLAQMELGFEERSIIFKNLLKTHSMIYQKYRNSRSQ